MSQTLQIRNGEIYDPANGIEGQVRDLYVHNGKMVEELPADTKPRIIDATAMIIMPGGVDIHCHIVSASVNRARMMQGEEHATHVHQADEAHGVRGGTGTLTPSTFTTGHKYAGLGYTTAIDAAVAPSAARHAHLELQDTPNIDAGILLLLANHQQLIELLDRDDRQGAMAFTAAMLHATGALGVKVVNPGGVASWRCDARQYMVESIDDKVAGTSVTARKILETMADAAESLNLPHPPHVHCNRLGLPGNVETTLETLGALDGRRVHLTHLQFHAYGQTEKGDFSGAADRLSHYINEHPQVTADVGQVVFGDALTLTADTPLEYLLWQLTGKRYVSIETELETGCGMMPIRYSDRSYLHSLQWATAMQLMLEAKDPWRMLLSTDHPNGGSFLSYPTIIAALMSKAVRDEQMQKANRRAIENTRLKDLDRELTLGEVAIITRAGPARVLGLSNKGHLGPGADADITLYDRNAGDPEAMFSSPRYVVKAGQIILEDGHLRQTVDGRTLRAQLSPDDQGRKLIRQWFDRYGSYSVHQFGLHDFERDALKPVEAAGH